MTEHEDDIEERIAGEVSIELERIDDRFERTS